MAMLERERFIDLVHRELDGELTGDERELLCRMLAQDTDRREFRERLQLLHKALEKIPDVKPPLTLRDKVLATVASPRLREAARGGRDITDLKRITPRHSLRHMAYPLAAGLLGLAILGVWLLGTGSAGTGLEPSTASGTMGLSLDSGRLLDEAGTSLEGLTAHAGLYRSGENFILLLDMDAPETVEVAVTCAPSGCDVQEFSWLEGSAEGTQLAAGRLTATVTGKAGLTASFPDSGRRWIVEFTASGVSLGRLSLAAEPGTGEHGNPAQGLPDGR